VIRLLRNIQIDRLSFWIGFIAGALFWWMLSTIRAFLPGFIKYLRELVQKIRDSASISIETRLRNDILNIAQKQHIASILFSLDEIVVEPRLLAPPIQAGLNKGMPPVDIVNLVVPYTPDWPELAATYNAPTLTLIEALQGKVNLILMGNPGSGKTVALAHLASQIARCEPELGDLSNYVPLFIHAAEIPTSVNIQVQGVSNNETKAERTRKPTDLLVEALAKNVSRLTLPRLPNLINTLFTSQRALLILDGLDELTPERTKCVVNFIGKLLEQYPTVRIIVAGSPDNIDRLPSLGFYPIAMAAWSEEQHNKFVTNWGHMWLRYVTPSDSSTNISIDPLFLNSWLLTRDFSSTPLETTLKTWAAYAGDILGPDTTSSIEAYIRRITAALPDSRPALEKLALQMVLKLSSSASQQEVNQWILESHPGQPSTNHVDSDIESTQETTLEQQQIRRLSGLSTLIANGLLSMRPEPRISFAHPIFTGYLASRALDNSSDLIVIQEQPNWIGKSMTLAFLACWKDVSSLIQDLMRKDDFVHTEQLRIARWLRIAPKHLAWRSIILRSLANTLNREASTLGLAARQVSAMALSNDPGVSVLFRQLIKSDDHNIQHLGVLGCGLVRDNKAIDELGQLTQVNSPILARTACLALVAIGEKNALEIVATALLHGSDQLSRMAAEALANDPIEGHPALEEGSKMADLMVRRSVVFGLARIHQPWALQIIDKIQLEEDEWIVRNAAIQAFEDLKHPNPYIPQPMPPTTELPWLIDFAAKQGMGVAPGKPALDLILRALKSGSEDEKFAALEYLSLNGTENLAPNLYDAYFSSQGDIHEAAYNALWLWVAARVKLPPPQQFGFGSVR
jgi:HEAT repeat protein